MSQRKVAPLTGIAREMAVLQIDTSAPVMDPLALTSPRRTRKRTRWLEDASPRAFFTRLTETERVWASGIEPSWRVIVLSRNTGVPTSDAVPSTTDALPDL